MLAEYFGVSTDYLLGNGVSEAMVGRPCTFAGRELTKDEAFLLSLYSKIPPQEQQRLIGRAEYIAEQAEEHARELEQAKRLEIQQSTMDESTLCETIDIPFSTLLVSAGLVTLINHLLGNTAPFIATLIKMVVDTVLFFVSYTIQREWVFAAKK